MCETDILTLQLYTAPMSILKGTFFISSFSSSAGLANDKYLMYTSSFNVNENSRLPSMRCDSKHILTLNVRIPKNYNNSERA